jgi:chemotaxis protein CheC
MKDLLTELEFDALSEIFNIGIGRAASSLSEMVNQRVDLSVPNVDIISNKVAKEKLYFNESEQLSVVSQAFSGDFNGHAFLMFGQENGLKLVSRLLGDKVPIEALTELKQDCLVEIGNVILNACFGTVINFLKSSIEISMPEFSQGSIDEIFTFDSPDEWSLYIKVKFSLPNDNIEGHISFVMDITSLEVFRKSVSQFVKSLDLD